MDHVEDWTATAAGRGYADVRVVSERTSDLSPRMMGLTVLVLGLVASVTAVVRRRRRPAEGSCSTLAITSVIGLVVFVAGIVVPGTRAKTG
jgi:hypothetical protein